MFKNKYGYEPESIGIFQPTSPFRTSSHIEKSYRQFLSSGRDALIGVVNVGNRHIKYGYECKTGKSLILEQETLNISDEDYFIRNGAIYFVKTDAFRKTGLIVPNNPSCFVMDLVSSINIDTQEDLDLALSIARGGSG